MTRSRSCDLDGISCLRVVPCFVIVSEGRREEEGVVDGSGRGGNDED